MLYEKEEDDDDEEEEEGENDTDYAITISWKGLAYLMVARAPFVHACNTYWQVSEAQD